jgi:hypothetical protein
MDPKLIPAAKRSRWHRTNTQFVSALLHRCVAGRTLPDGRCGPVGRRSRDTARGIPVPRVCRLHPRHSPALPHPQTLLAASGAGLAVFRPRESHHPPHRGARRRNPSVPSRNQPRRRGRAHRHQRTRTDGAPNARRRPLRPGLGETVARGPSIFDTTRLGQAGGTDTTNPDPVAELQQRATPAGLQTASLDEILCITAA